MLQPGNLSRRTESTITSIMLKMMSLRVNMQLLCSMVEWTVRLNPVYPVECRPIL